MNSNQKGSGSKQDSSSSNKQSGSAGSGSGSSSGSRSGNQGGTQGGTHEQHVEAGRQSHKNDTSKTGGKSSNADKDR